MSQLVAVSRDKGTFPTQSEPNTNVGPSSIRPPVQDNVKRDNAITSPRSGCLIDHRLEDLVDVLIQLSPSLSPSSVSENDSVCKDATDSTPINWFPHTDLVGLRNTK